SAAEQQWEEQSPRMAEEPLALVAEPAPPPPVIVPVVTPALDAETFAPRAATGVITRSLEDIWDELPDMDDL
ncbi:MAG TPA: hypothetical protein VIC27_07400, partial [Ktedonobacterales bacterium]